MNIRVVITGYNNVFKVLIVSKTIKMSLLNIKDISKELIAAPVIVSNAVDRFAVACHPFSFHLNAEQNL